MIQIHAADFGKWLMTDRDERRIHCEFESF